MYFKNRAEAGRKLAIKLAKYDNQQCVVIALNSGAVLVGAQIAMKLHAKLAMLVSDTIILPGEHEPIASMTTSTFTYNSAFSKGEIEEFAGEYRGVIDAQRISKLHKLNTFLKDGGEVKPADLRSHIVILVSDGLQTGITLDIASDFLKPVKLKKLIIATPLANVDTIDQMHLLGDDIYALNVGESLMETDHYYDDNVIPDYKDSMKIIRNISMTWDLANKP